MTDAEPHTELRWTVAEVPGRGRVLVTAVAADGQLGIGTGQGPDGPWPGELVLRDGQRWACAALREGRAWRVPMPSDAEQGRGARFEAALGPADLRT